MRRQQDWQHIDIDRPAVYHSDETDSVMKRVTEHNFSKLDKKLSLFSRKLSSQHSKEQNDFIEKLLLEKNLPSSSLLARLSKFLITQLSKFSLEFISLIFESINPHLQINQKDKDVILLRFNSYFNSQMNQHENKFNDCIASHTLPKNTKDAFKRGFQTEISQIRQDSIQEIEIRIDEHNEVVSNKVRKENSKIEEDIIDIKPNFYGIGLNLNAIWKRMKGWLKKDSETI